MALSRRKFSAEFKLRAVRQVEAGASTAAVARRYEIHPTLLTKWVVGNLSGGREEAIIRGRIWLARCKARSTKGAACFPKRRWNSRSQISEEAAGL